MADLIGTRLGQYEVLELLGQGGMAMVYKAHQPSMDRAVAIKVISSNLADNAEFVARFEREARLIAKLQHAHILPVYDYGQQGDVLYLVMRLVEDGSLDKRLRQGALPLSEAGRLLTQIAAALTYAHNEGIIHRDLKPNNILLDKNGDPYLTDFGIAKLVTSSMALTATGTVVGTPSYMAPEQWRGGEIDSRADIYALGVMLYEMLTGKLPFTGDTPYILMYKHFDEIPPAPTELIPALPAGINDIIRRAMAKEPRDRFASADQMAAAFNAVLSGSPTRPVDPEREARTITINPTEGQTARLRASASTGALPAPTRLAARLPLRRIALVGIPILVILLAVGLFLMTRSQPFRLLTTIHGHQQAVQALAWSPDGSRLASAGEDQIIDITDATTGQTLLTLRGHTDLISSLAWNPDGTKIASASPDGSVRIWDPARGEVIRTLTTSNPPSVVSWNPDGSKLAAGLGQGAIEIWDLANQNKAVTYTHEGAFWEPVAWSPDGKKIACGGKDNNIDLIDSTNGTLLGSFPAHSDFVYGLNWNRDGSQLSSTSHDGTARTWDLTTGKALPLLTLHASDGGVMLANWSPDGKELVTSSGFTNLGGVDDPTVKIWMADTGKLLFTLSDLPRPTMAAVWSPDGKTLATAGVDSDIRIWSTDQ